MDGAKKIVPSGNISTTAKAGERLFQMEGDTIDTMPFQINTVRDHTEIIGRSKNWLTLAFRESLAIKEFNPELNKGLKSCKDLSLF